MAARVVGIGGIFFKARDPDRLRACYREHLGLAITDWGGVVFEPMMASPAGRAGTTVVHLSLPTRPTSSPGRRPS
jgi:hypothetical protein